MSSRTGHAPRLAGANQQGTFSAISRLHGMQNVTNGMELGTDFPMLCENCLGGDKFMRMVRLPTYSPCKITGRPFRRFQWRPARNLPPRETIACYEICAEKNICQCCLNDLDFNIPFALREAFESSERAALGPQGIGGPVSEVNQTFQLNQRLAERAAGGTKKSASSMYQLLNYAANATDSKSAAQDMKLPELCLGWLKGRCTRSQCFYRPCCGAIAFPEVHSTFPDETSRLISDLKTGGPAATVLRNKNLKKALFNAARAAAQEKKVKAMEPPADKSITTLFLVRIPKGHTSGSIHNALSVFGNIESVKYDAGKPHAFVCFEKREDAERCISELQGKLLLGNVAVTMGWALRKDDCTLPSLSENVSAAADLPKTVEVCETFEEPKPINDKLEGSKPPSILSIEPLPQLIPGVPIPFDFSAGEALPPAPKGLYNCYSGIPSHKKRKLPNLKSIRASESYDVEKIASYYPSMKPEALEGNIILF